MSKVRHLFIILIIFLYVPSLTSCSNESNDKPISATQTQELELPIESNQSSPSTPIVVKLILSKLPALNEPTELTFIISSIKDAPNTRASILLENETVLINGDLNWVGDLYANKPQMMKATIAFISTGNKVVRAKALSDQSNGDVWGDIASIYLHITEDSGFIGFETREPRDSTHSEQSPTIVK